MAKKDGLEIFELFRSGSSKSEAADATPPPAPARERSTARESRPAPAPSLAAPSSPANPGEARISLRLNTALFGLMVGTACLFGTFALGVQYERRHVAAAAPAADEPRVASMEEAQPLPSIIRETRRENPPTVAQPASGETRVPPPVAEPRKGWTLQLMCYTPEQESTAQTLLKKVRDAGGADAGLVRDKSNNFVVVAGFVEKQSGAEAEAVLNKYRNLAGRLNKSFNLDWIGATR